MKVLDKEINALNDIHTDAKSLLKHMNRSDINELRSFGNPPEIIQEVLIVASLIVGEKGDWPTAKSVEFSFKKRSCKT